MKILEKLFGKPSRDLSLAVSYLKDKSEHIRSTGSKSIWPDHTDFTKNNDFRSFKYLVDGLILEIEEQRNITDSLRVIIGDPTIFLEDESHH